MSDDRIVIVGAGPAGMEAALKLVKLGLHPIVIDAGARSGGQVYRRPPVTHRRSYRAIYGADAAKARHLHDAFDFIRDTIDYRPNTQVWAAHAGELFLDGPDGRTTLTYDKLILCTGATDRVFPIPGWEASGCYSLGGAQIALKSQSLTLGDPIGFVGAGPLLWLVAWQHLQLGAQVAGVWCTATRRDLLRALPWLTLRPRLALRGARQILALWRAGISVQFDAHPIAVTASDDGSITGFKIDNIEVLDASGNILFEDNADDEVGMTPMNGLEFAWEQYFYDYGDITQPGSLDWEVYPPGAPFNGNTQLDMAAYAGADIRIRFTGKMDEDDDAGNGDGGRYMQMFVL